MTRESPTCTSWGPGAPSSECPRGRRRRRHRRPRRRSRPSRTERCCLTAAGRAAREEAAQCVRRVSTSTAAASPQTHRMSNLRLLRLAHLGHKVVPHAELRRDELLPVRGSLHGDGGRSRRRLLHGSTGNQHPHVEPAPVAVHVLGRGLRRSRWGGEEEEQEEETLLANETGEITERRASAGDAATVRGRSEAHHTPRATTHNDSGEPNCKPGGVSSQRSQSFPFPDAHDSARTHTDKYSG